MVEGGKRGKRREGGRVLRGCNPVSLLVEVYQVARN